MFYRFSGEKGSAKKGCLITLLVIVVILIILAIFLFNLPQKIGIVASPGEQLISQTPDRETAAALTADMAKTGINTSGIDIYVMPKKNSDKSVMVAILDTSKGFSFNNLGVNGSIDSALAMLAKLDESGKYGIEQIVLDYRESADKSLVSITAPTATILKYSKGTMSREDFMQAIEGKVDLSGLAENVLQ